MSHQGSPYSSTFVHQEYDCDFEDDRYEDADEEKEYDDRQADESDEDTEEASETEMGKNEEPVEIKEQMYQDKLANLKKQLQQLKDGSHPEYNRRVKRLEYQYKERLRLNAIYREYMMECVEREYTMEKKSATKEFEDKKIDLKANLLTDFEEKKRIIESERQTMELTGDSMEVKPVMTRKLRRRPNDPVPVQEKRRKPTTSQVTFLLDEKEVEADLKIIMRKKEFSAVRKPTVLSSSTAIAVSHPVNDSNLVETKIEDGKLLYERRWFHRGQSVYVEGRDLARFSANISAIGTEAIWVKKVTDGTKFRIFVSQLTRGKISIKRRAS